MSSSVSNDALSIAPAALRSQRTRLPLARWLWRSYLRSALVPLLAIELSFLAAYWTVTSMTYQSNVAAVADISRQELERATQRESHAISAQLDGISALTQVLGAAAAGALSGVPEASQAERARYEMNADGVFYTREPLGSDSTAAFYSGIVPVGPEQLEKVWRSVDMDRTLAAVQRSSPLVVQAYLNTHDSYNRIYPYFDVMSQYAPKMDIPSYNFYYEADAAHNPQRKVVWTDAYVDPAGAGWMTSAIYPVYRGDFLEGVVGLDVTIAKIIDQVLRLDLPWEGYGVLVGRDGTVMALPPAGEADWGLSDVTDHRYADAIRGDTFRSNEFNLRRRRDLQQLALAVFRDDQGSIETSLKGRVFQVSWARMPGPGWTLLLMAPREEILAEANALRKQLGAIGWGMIVVLVVFYSLFFTWLFRRAAALSVRVAEPITALEALIRRIGQGEYEQPLPNFDVSELQNVGGELVRMGARLGAAHGAVMATQEKLHKAFERERQLTDAQRRFISMVSHEFRTPLAIIDGTAQSMQRRADRMTAEAIVERTNHLRDAVHRLTQVMDSALAFAKYEAAASAISESVDLPDVVARVCQDLGAQFPDRLLQLHRETFPDRIPADAAMLRVLLAAIVDNALRYSRPGDAVDVSAEVQGGLIRIRVADQGPGIPEAERARLGERFFRGEGGIASHGAGLGLYLARTFVELHGGSLDVRSVTGAGTVVDIVLPAQQAANQGSVP